MTAPRPHHEPEENELQRVALLADLVAAAESAIETAVRHGLAGELRQMLAKFPEALPEASKQKEAAPQPATGATVSTPAPSYDIDLMLGLSNAAYRLDDHARRAKPGSANQNADASCAAFLRAEIAKLKGGTPV